MNSTGFFLIIILEVTINFKLNKSIAKYKCFHVAKNLSNNETI